MCKRINECREGCMCRFISPHKCNWNKSVFMNTIIDIYCILLTKYYINMKYKKNAHKQIERELLIAVILTEVE